MRAPYDLKRIAAPTLYSRAAAGRRGYEVAYPLPLDGAHFDGVSIDPESGYRQLVVYLDDDTNGIPLIAGNVIRAPFSALRVAPLHPASYYVGNVAGASPAVALVAQRAVLRLWRSAPPLPAELAPFPRTLVLTQRLVTIAAPSGSPVAGMLVHCPGVRRLMAWVSDDNNAHTANINVDVYGLRPEVGDDQDLFSSSPQNGTLLKTPAGANLSYTISSGAGSYSAQQMTVVDPGIVEVGFTLNSSDAFSVRVGVVLDFDVGA